MYVKLTTSNSKIIADIIKMYKHNVFVLENNHQILKKYFYQAKVFQSIYYWKVNLIWNK